MNSRLSSLKCAPKNRTILRWFSTLVVIAVSAVQSQGVSVKDFGAAGNGSTDDTAAFQDAIDHAGKNDGVVEIPAGRYVIDDDVTVDHSIAFVGSGYDQSIITAPGRTTRFFVEESGTSFQDLGFEEMIEPIALVSRADYVLKDLRFERCRFEEIATKNPNSGAIALSTNSKSQRVCRISNVLVKDCLFQNLDAHAINIRANISDTRVIDNEFYNLISSQDDSAPNWALGGFAIRLGESSDDAEMEEEFATQGYATIERNVIRNMQKKTVVGNLKAILLYGNYNKISDNLIEDIDGTPAGDDVNAMYIRGAYNEISRNTVRNIRGNDDDGAVSFKGGLDLGSQHNVVFHNYIENVDGMSAVEASSSHIEFYENEIVNASTRGFYQRKGDGSMVRDNIFRNANTDLRTVGGEVTITRNWYINSMIWISQRRDSPSNREAVHIHDNIFQNTNGSDLRMIRLANGIDEDFVSVRDNRFEYLDGSGGGDAVDLESNGTVEEVEIIGNHIETDGSASFGYRLNSPKETVSGNTTGDDGSFTDMDSNEDGPGIPASPLAPVLPQDLSFTGSGNPTLGMGWTGLAGHVYQIEVSNDLKNWTAHGEPIVGDGTKVEVDGLPGAGEECNFYRVTVTRSSL